MALREASIDRFEEQLAPVLDTAYRVALRLARNADDASDLVQDAMLNAIKGWSTFQEGTNFRAWFLKILTNAFLNKRRTAGRIETTDIDEAPDLYLYEQAKKSGDLEGEGDPGRELLDRIAVEHVARAIDRLPDEFRLTASLYLMNEMTYEEIAQIVDCPLGTVRSRIHRSRNMLQRELWHMLETEEGR